MYSKHLTALSNYMWIAFHTQRSTLHRSYDGIAILSPLILKTGSMWKVLRYLTISRECSPHFMGNAMKSVVAEIEDCETGSQGAARRAQSDRKLIRPIRTRDK